MRRAAVYLLIAAGILFAVLGTAAVYIRDSVIDSDEAAERAVDALSRPEVRNVISSTVVDQLVIAAPDTLAARPLLEQVVSGALSAPGFRSVYETAIRDLHRTVFLGETDTLTVKLSDMVLVVKTQATALSPQLGEQIPDNLTDTLIDLQSNPTLLNAVQIGEDIRLLAFVLPLAAFIVFIGAVFLAADRRRGLVQVGFALIAVGIIVLIVERLAGMLFIRGFQTDTIRDVAQVFWNAFAGQLTLWSLVIAGVGAVLVASVWWVSEPIDIGARLMQLRRFVDPPARTRPRLFWILGWAVAGILLIVAWQESLQVIVTLIGVVFLVNALGELLRMIAPRQLIPVSDRTAAGRDAPASPRYRQPLLIGLGLLAAAGVIVGGYFAIAGSGGSGTDAAPPAAAAVHQCNGHISLCDRRFNEIAIAATHNSMSSAEDGFSLANHSRGIIHQLNRGYRGLLIDLYYGLESERTLGVVTDIAPHTPEERAQLVEQWGEATVRSAEELRRRTIDAGGERKLYLCHRLCETGATPFAAELERLRGWLQANPGETLLIIIEDNVEPQDVSAAFENAKLLPYLHTQTPGAQWPTLRQMIDSGRRLVVMAEKKTGDIPWYHNAYAFTQETPFSFETVDQFNCDPNRGSPDNPLFMINHWITPASANAADTANTAETLNQRIADCQTKRNRSPNIIAVDFYARGDTLSVVAELNGIQ